MATARPRPGRQVRRASPGAAEQVASQLRRALVERRLRPGDRLGTEQELADEFGVSRPTLREALRLLSASQLLRVGRGRAGGIFVARTPGEGMSATLGTSVAHMLAAGATAPEELLDARLALEVPLAGRAAANASDAVVARLEAALAAAGDHEPGSDAFAAAGAAFHRALADAAGNEVLRGLAGAIAGALQPSLVALLSGPADREPLLEQHRAILRAVRRHQRGAAEKAMTAHLTYLAEVLRRAPASGARRRA